MVGTEAGITVKKGPHVEPLGCRLLPQKLQVFRGDRGHVFAKVGDEAAVDRMLSPLHRPPLRFS